MVILQLQSAQNKTKNWCNNYLFILVVVYMGLLDQTAISTHFTQNSSFFFGVASIPFVVMINHSLTCSY